MRIIPGTVYSPWTTQSTTLFQCLCMDQVQIEQEPLGKARSNSSDDGDYML